VAFCKAILDVDVTPSDPEKPVYNLDHLKNRHTPLPTDPTDNIALVQVRELRFEVVGARRRITLDANPQGAGDDIYEMMEECFSADRLPLSRLRVVHARFHLTFMPEGQDRAEGLTFNVGLHSCDLKSKPDTVRVIGERCLRRWGIAHD
jgi:hypothetical protein